MSRRVSDRLLKQKDLFAGAESPSAVQHTYARSMAFKLKLEVLRCELLYRFLHRSRESDSPPVEREKEVELARCGLERGIAAVLQAKPRACKDCPTSAGFAGLPFSFF